ncbi:hypothetical protein V2J09_006877 [Rumex salicifolius]
MANPSILALAMLFMVSSSLIAFTMASSDSPFIVAQKKASLTKLRDGSERVSVSIDIYNQGSVTAFDVSLTDDSWPVDQFTVVSGNTSMSWEKLDGGASVSHSFELDAKMKGPFQGAPAVIKFRVPTKSALQEAYSSPIFPLNINAETIPVDKLELRILARVGPQITVISIVSFFIYLLASPSKSGAAKGNKKRR